MIPEKAILVAFRDALAGYVVTEFGAYTAYLVSEDTVQLRWSFSTMLSAVTFCTLFVEE